MVAINILKDLPTWLKVAITLEKSPTSTDYHTQRLMWFSRTPRAYKWYVSTVFTWGPGMYGKFCYIHFLCHGGLMHDTFFDGIQYTLMAAL